MDEGGSLSSLRSRQRQDQLCACFCCHPAAIRVSGKSRSNSFDCRSPRLFRGDAQRNEEFQPSLSQVPGAGRTSKDMIMMVLACSGYLQLSQKSARGSPRHFAPRAFKGSSYSRIPRIHSASTGLLTVLVPVLSMPVRKLSSLPLGLLELPVVPARARCTQFLR